QIDERRFSDWGRRTLLAEARRVVAEAQPGRTSGVEIGRVLEAHPTGVNQAVEPETTGGRRRAAHLTRSLDGSPRRARREPTAPRESDKRPGMCEHRIPPGQHCRWCDA